PPATVDPRRGAHQRPAPDIERADALRTIQLVGRQAQEVDPHRLDIERDLAGGLRGVAVEPGAPGMGERGDLGERLYYADLVVHRHDRDQRGALGDRPGQAVRPAQPV